MAHKDVVPPEEEEDLGTAMQKLQIPLNVLEKLPIDSMYGLADGIKKIVEGSKLLVEDAREYDDRSHNGSSKASENLLRNSSNSPLTAKRGLSLAPKQSRNKRGRQKRRRCFKSAACLFDPKGKKSCSHCGTRKTPLWREGPRGAGTLCNACGMQYRKGRLLPEYRPASSPDFKPNIHSNFHRKVMEIRREKKPPPSTSESCQH